MAPVIRPQSLSETVLNRLRDDIVHGELALGHLLSERVLAEKLGVSKTPVRESLARLEIEGLVRIVPQRGAFVFTLSSDEVTTLCEFRLTLEAAALRFAIERKPRALASDLAHVVERMKRARSRGNVRDYLDADTAFHEVFFAHCENSYLRDTYALHVGKIAALRTHLSGKPLHTEKSFAEHEEIARLLADGALQHALSVLDVHIERSKTTYASGIDDIAAADRGPPARPSRISEVPRRAAPLSKGSSLDE
jgi:DNA-binding GntR family transcriptional regulator